MIYMMSESTELPDDLPWIITIGPDDDSDEDWEPVVCGPYIRDHAIAMAHNVIADTQLVAVVEPLLPATGLEEIRNRIEEARREARELDATEDDDAIDSDFEFEGDDDDDEHAHGPAEAPSADEIRAGFVRISARLTGSGNGS